MTKLTVAFRNFAKAPKSGRKKLSFVQHEQSPYKQFFKCKLGIKMHPSFTQIKTSREVARLGSHFKDPSTENSTASDCRGIPIPLI
jgi:hypothetical protein